MSCRQKKFVFVFWGSSLELGLATSFRGIAHNPSRRGKTKRFLLQYSNHTMHPVLGSFLFVRIYFSVKGNALFCLQLVNVFSPRVNNVIKNFLVSMLMDSKRTSSAMKWRHNEGMSKTRIKKHDLEFVSIIRRAKYKKWPCTWHEFI